MTHFGVRTAGESHGRELLALVEGVPFGLRLDLAAIDADLARRQLGFGRSSRMQLERDRADVVAGLYHGVTSGAPLAIVIRNVDASLETLPPLHRPRPGHADLAGAERFATTDARPVLERASARETAARVAGGAVAKQILAAIGAEVCGYVVAIGGVEATPLGEDLARRRAARDAASDGLMCPDAAAVARMKDVIRAAGAAGDTLGGCVEVVASGIPAGLGSLEQWDSRLDARLAAAALSIPSAKAFEIGDGFAAAAARGSTVHDPIGRRGGKFVRATNHAGGIEGGMSNGESIVVRIGFKPLATLRSPLPTIDLRGGPAAAPDPQRSDVCALPAASVVAEAVVATALAAAVRERWGGPTLTDLVSAVARDRAVRDALFHPEEPA